jgi:hypothetical protein
MENKLYQMMGELGGMEIPLNQPAGGSNDKRLRSRGGEQGHGFPAGRRCGQAHQHQRQLKAAKAGVVVDLKHSIQNRQTLEAEIEVINDHEIAGWRHVRGWAQNRWIYFHAEFSKPFTAELFVADVLQQGKSSVTGKNVKARLNFATATARRCW